MPPTSGKHKANDPMRKVTDDLVWNMGQPVTMTNMRDTLSATAKYRRMRKVTDGVVSVCSETNDSLFHSRLLQLVELYDYWRKGIEETITAVKSNEVAFAVSINNGLPGETESIQHDEHDYFMAVPHSSALHVAEQTNSSGENSGVDEVHDLRTEEPEQVDSIINKSAACIRLNHYNGSISIFKQVIMVKKPGLLLQLMLVIMMFKLYFSDA